MTDAQLRVTTRLARAIDDAILFRGVDLTRDLIEEDYLSVVSLALGNRRLNEEECALIGRLGVLASIGDPRIWPMKMARIIGSYGRPQMAIAASFAMLDDAPIGPHPAQLTAKFFASIADQHLDRAKALSQAKSVIAKWMADKRSVPGFGVPKRQEDERNKAIHRWYAQNVEVPGRHWELYRDIAAHMSEHYDLGPNFAAPIAAIALDVGFDADVVAVFTSFLVFWGIAANAHEGTRESPEVLRRLPDEFIEYVGPAPRKSPRAQAALTAED